MGIYLYHYLFFLRLFNYLEYWDAIGTEKEFEKDPLLRVTLINEEERNDLNNMI